MAPRAGLWAAGQVEGQPASWLSGPALESLNQTYQIKNGVEVAISVVIVVPVHTGVGGWEGCVGLKPT